MKTILTHSQIAPLVAGLMTRILDAGQGSRLSEPKLVYPIPRGGVAVAYALTESLSIKIVDDPSKADYFVDDLIDSGATMRRYCDEYPGTPFFALIDKTDSKCAFKDQWVVFPWEVTDAGADESGTDIVVRLLQLIGENPDRGGLEETPARFIKAFRHYCSGYGKDAATILKTFKDGADDYDQMVVVKDIPIYSHCEHHLAAIIGTATIAYIPNGKIVGLSKMSRLADMFARRLQVQERMTNQIADAMMEHLQPLGVGVVIKARHLCMESRGVCQQGHHTITVALRGVIKDEPQTRAEYLQLAN